MNPIGTVSPLTTSPLTRLEPISPAQLPGTTALGSTPSVPTDSFGVLLDNLVGGVVAKENAAAATTQQVLLGNTGQLHQSMIAMQESGVAFSLMVQVRNKLVESYQELMRMQV